MPPYNHTQTILRNCDHAIPEAVNRIFFLLPMSWGPLDLGKYNLYILITM